MDKPMSANIDNKYEGVSLYTETNLSKAIVELLSQVDDRIAKYLFTEEKAGSIKAYIFGGCAVHLYTNARGSNDLDVEFEAIDKLDLNEVVLDIDDVYFNDPDTGESVLVLDDGFNIGLTPVLTPDYKERAAPFFIGENGLEAFLADPIDIAVSKLSRCAADDVIDIISLYRKKCFNLEEFRCEAIAALEYSATPDGLRSNIDHVILKLESS